ncbi:MAG: hypothetical protein GC181_03640 [Bacteroidetes bacterium]|nr:hypothetical protein [Bacteroidota bacterium]
MRKPDFICIGAPRTGTTWLFENLSTHPDIFIPGQKAINFFNVHFDNGFEWYCNHFAKTDKKICGELSPLYFGSETVLQRIHELCPDSKIIISVRDPLDRLESQVSLINSLRNHELSMQERVDENPSIMEMGLYFKNVTTAQKYFPKENIFILNFNQIADEPEVVYSEVLKFLGLPDYTPQKLNSKIGYNIKPKYPFVEMMRVRIAKLLIKWNLGKIIHAVKRSGLTDKIRSMNNSTPQKKITDTEPVKNPEKFQFASYYKDDLAQFEKEFNIQVSRYNYAELSR